MTLTPEPRSSGGDHAREAVCDRSDAPLSTPQVLGRDEQHVGLQGQSDSTFPITTNHNRVEDASLPSNSLNPTTLPLSQKASRSTLFYPSADFQAKTNLKPFSDSAAKRESVLALGSIEGFQNYYARQGLAAATAPSATRGNGKLALGPAALVACSDPLASPKQLHSKDVSDSHSGEGAGNSSRARNDEPTESNPPSESIEIPRSTWKGRLFPDIPRPTELDLSTLLKHVNGCLAVTRQLWHLDTLVESPYTFSSSSMQNDEPPDLRTSRSIDLVRLIDSTMKTIEAVRKYFIALPPSTKPRRDFLRANTAALEAAQSQTVSPFLEEGGSVKSKDIFQRKTSFRILARRPSSMLISSGFAAPAAAIAELQRQDTRRTASNSDFVPFDTVTRSSFFRRQSQEDMTARGPSDLAAKLKKISIAEKATNDDLETLLNADESQNGVAAPYSGSAKVDANTEVPEILLDADPLTIVRSVALEVLDMLHRLKISSRLPSGRSEEQDTADLQVSKTAEGAMVQSSLTLASLGEERKLVERYLTIVMILLDGAKPSVRKTQLGGASEQTPASLGRFSLDAEIGDFANEHGGLRDGRRDQEIPLWAGARQRGSELERARLMLCDLLPSVSEYLSCTEPRPKEDEDSDLLSKLADGQLLCHGFNAAVRRSRKAWGFIPSTTIHDMRTESEQGSQMPSRSISFNTTSSVSLTGVETNSEDGEGSDRSGSIISASVRGDISVSRRKTGWTFRCVENLNRFVNAIRLRYDIQMATGGTPPADPLPQAMAGSQTNSASGSASPRQSQPIKEKKLRFDAVKVARQEDGEWRGMLRDVVVAWASRVAEEAREG